MNELVLMHHNEPMTTSETLAEGVQLQHKNVVALIRKHVADLSEWGEVAFQTRLNPQGSATEFAWLNEGQSLFLLTLMKNSPVVVAFKKALVKAFLELRAMLTAAPAFTTRQLDHGADLAVAADRTFRGFLRSARSAGLRMPAALRVANAQTVARTGMDMLAELGVDPDAPQAAPPSPVIPDPIAQAIAQWAAQAGDGWYTMEKILGESMGVKPGDRDYSRLTIFAGRALVAAGFLHRKVRMPGERGRNGWRRRTEE